jgi:hypothetical protein
MTIGVSKTGEADEKLGHGLKQTQKCGGATLDIYCQCEHQNENIRCLFHFAGEMCSLI